MHKNIGHRSRRGSFIYIWHLTTISAGIGCIREFVYKGGAEGCEEDWRLEERDTKTGRKEPLLTALMNLNIKG
jgi:hypothetical protein